MYRLFQHLSLGVLIATAGSTISAQSTYTQDNDSSEVVARENLEAYVTELEKPYSTCTITMLERDTSLNPIERSKFERKYQAIFGPKSRMYKFVADVPMEVRRDSGEAKVEHVEHELQFYSGKKISISHLTQNAEVVDWPATAPPDITSEFGIDALNYAISATPIVSRFKKIKTISVQKDTFSTLKLESHIPSSSGLNVDVKIDLTFDVAGVEGVLKRYQIGTPTRNADFFVGTWDFDNWKIVDNRLRPFKMIKTFEFYTDDPEAGAGKLKSKTQREYIIKDLSFDEAGNSSEWGVPPGYHSNLDSSIRRHD